MLNPKIDIPLWRKALNENGFTQVQSFLELETAERIYQCLDKDVPWTLAIRDQTGARTIKHAEYSALSDDQLSNILHACADIPRGLSAHENFRFAYDSYMMVTAYLEKRDPGLLLHNLLEQLNSEPFLRFARMLTGDVRIRRTQAQATRYTPGHFLRWHDDEQAEEGRLYAYVLNLTKRWRSDWGGLLQFVPHNSQQKQVLGESATFEEENVESTFMPRWNSLSLFKVPYGHQVSQVAPYAEEPRYAITGWFTA